MPAFQVPEIMRVPLEELVLQIHLLGLGSAAEFLPELLQPPPQKSVDAAVRSLQTIGMLSRLHELIRLFAYPFDSWINAHF
jgi:HrpA-like RNA helicase